MKAFLMFINFFFFLASLGLSAQANTPATPPDTQDTEAITSLPTQHFGTAQVVKGIDAASGNHDDANNPSASTTLSSPTPTSTIVLANSTRRATKLPIIIGSVISVIILLGILTIMFVVLRRKRIDRISFHRDMMVQERLPPRAMAQSSPASLVSASIDLHPRDLEQGLHNQGPSQEPNKRLPNLVIRPTAQIAGPRGRRPVLRTLELDPSPHTPLPRAPAGPRTPYIHQSPLVPRSALPRSARAMSPARVRSPIPRSPSPRTHRQRAIADQIEILRIQMLEFEREGGNDNTTMNEMSDKMAWLRGQQEGEWALGLTEEAPVGYDRYMT